MISQLLEVEKICFNVFLIAVPVYFALCTSELNRHEKTHQTVDHSSLFLKSSLIDVEEGICFVRSTLKGQDFKFGCLEFKTRKLISEWHQFLKLNPIFNVQQSGHKELTIDQLRDLCLKKLTNSELKSACNGLNINKSNGLSIEDLRSLLINHFEASLLSQNRESSSMEMNKLFPSYNHSNDASMVSSIIASF